MDQRGQVLRSDRVANIHSEIGVAVKIVHPNDVKAIGRARLKFRSIPPGDYG